MRRYVEGIKKIV